VHLAEKVNKLTGRETITKDRVLPDDQLIDGFLLKPMNCPHHIKIFASQPHSYRDLPVRLAEFGTVYRWEQSGELNGMTRVRGFTQDDAHLFCTEEQVQPEILGCLSLVKTVLTTLGMSDYRVRVGLRDPDSNKYTGDPANWDKAEHACRTAAQTLGVPFTEEPGEAAFYGPKIDIQVEDAAGREWSLSTIQVDFHMPAQFGLEFVAADAGRERPVMVHRSLAGSMERLFGHLIEVHEGAFPAWFAPVQVVVLPVADEEFASAAAFAARCEQAGLRVEVSASGSLGSRVREAALRKVPYQAVIGAREAAQDQVSLRLRVEGELPQQSQADAAALLRSRCAPPDEQMS
jgi:threonyl-tRNA synthetase